LQSGFVGWFSGGSFQRRRETSATEAHDARVMKLVA
jgi:hypothetical protein